MKAITDLTGNYRLEKDGTLISLNWSNPWDAERRLAGFKLYHNINRDGKLQPDDKRPLAKLPRLKIKFNYFFSRTYLFAVKGVFRDGSMSTISNVFTIALPTIDLPTPRITRAYKVRNQVILQWMFPLDIPDLAEFRLYNNGRAIGHTIPKYQRSVQIEHKYLQPGTLAIAAVSKFNRMSPISRQFTLPL